MCVFFLGEIWVTRGLGGGVVEQQLLLTQLFSPFSVSCCFLGQKRQVHFVWYVAQVDWLYLLTVRGCTYVRKQLFRSRQPLFCALHFLCLREGFPFQKGEEKPGTSSVWEISCGRAAWAFPLLVPIAKMDVGTFSHPSPLPSPFLPPPSHDRGIQKLEGEKWWMKHFAKKDRSVFVTIATSVPVSNAFSFRTKKTFLICLWGVMGQKALSSSPFSPPVGCTKEMKYYGTVHSTLLPLSPYPFHSTVVCSLPHPIPPSPIPLKRSGGGGISPAEKRNEFNFRDNEAAHHYPPLPPPPSFTQVSFSWASLPCPWVARNSPKMKIIIRTFSRALLISLLSHGTTTVEIICWSKSWKFFFQKWSRVLDRADVNLVNRNCRLIWRRHPQSIWRIFCEGSQYVESISVFNETNL